MPVSSAWCAREAELSSWQLSFHIADGAALAAEMLHALTDADSVSIHREGDVDDPATPWQVTLLCPTRPDATAVAETLEQATAISGFKSQGVTIARLPERDWLAENRRSFPPLDIGRFWIYGSFVKTPPPAGKLAIRLDAGEAFGSGSHATTHGCLCLLERHGGEALRIADIGCGSGILAIAAALFLPAAQVIAADNDPVAVRVCAANLADNGVADRVMTVVSEGYAANSLAAAGPYDLIFANILPTPLIAMAAAAAARLAPSGRLILAGLMAQHETAVLEAHARQGLVLHDRFVMDDWVSLCLRHITAD